ncbi:uncharacterized protein LOC123026809 [Varanus komodoensis]|uniref:uncharacterized protein LOC123026809 n=1 Tax=Varanus komodoensis TaxID=61221 RepID=UPI001CF774E1|nr:uncharacterized protein LOC123026809 [Varanus komodoensis]
MVAKATLVHHSPHSVQTTSTCSSSVNTTQRDSPTPGPTLAETNSVVLPIDLNFLSAPLPSRSMQTTPPSELSRSVLGPTVLSSDIQAILESALRPSTRKSYSAKWRKFSSFVNACSFSLELTSIENILQFLFNLHRSGLKPSSIKIYTAAILHFRGSIHGSSVFSQPLIRRFLKGLQNLHPSVQPVMPAWSLFVVVQALTKPPFEPLATVDLRLVSWKTAFLVAVTSARRASELCAPRIDPPFLNFHKEKVVLRMDSEFLPKVATPFHLNQDIVLPAFFPSL